MEATKEDLNILYKIRPPRLEDAGLEDCALPAESIREAFLKAATAVGSRAASIFATEEEKEEDSRRDCINDSWPGEKLPSSASDALVGLAPEEVNPPGSCEAKKGGALIGEGEVGKDVVSGERNEEDVVKKDEVLVGGDGGGGDRAEVGDCVDGLKGLKIDEKKGNERGKEKKQPTLVEGYF